MKIECPVCHVQGILEQRGNSQRVIHYQYVKGKRIFSRHKIMGTVGYSSMGTVGTEKAENSLLKDNMAPPKGFEPLTDWLTASRSTGLSHGGKE
jgi:hypothetical protein